MPPGAYNLQCSAPFNGRYLSKSKCQPGGAGSHLPSQLHGRSPSTATDLQTLEVDGYEKYLTAVNCAIPVSKHKVTANLYSFYRPVRKGLMSAWSAFYSSCVNNLPLLLRRGEKNHRLSRVLLFLVLQVLVLWQSP